MLHQCLRFTKNPEAVPLLFKVICLIGLSWQLLEITSEYLQYKVNIQTTMFIPEQVEDLCMGICLPVAFAIDYKKLNSELRSNWTPTEFDRKEMYRTLFTHEIFNYTHAADNIIHYAGYWKDGWGWSKSKSTNLSLIMKTQKYFFEGNICYLYSVRSFKSFSVRSIRGGTVVFLNFGKEISETHVVWLFIGEKNTIPFRETTEARYIFRTNSSKKLDYFDSSHYSIRKKLLPPPYETGCFNYSELKFTNSIECFERCVVLKSFQKWGAILRRSLVPKDSNNYKFVRNSNENKNRAEVNELHVSCELSCPNINCEDTHIVTIQESKAYLGSDRIFKNTSIAWQRKTSSFPSVTILCRPSSTLPELILYIMSSISTWTGLSMMSFNPILLFRRLSMITSVPGISTLDFRQHRRVTATNHTNRMSPLEDCVVPQSLPINEFSKKLFRPANNRSRSAS